MNSRETYIRLNAGSRMPRIGFGTWRLQGGRQVTDAIKTALEAGYRLIDTAAIYGNEENVGEAVRSSGVPREDIFITTKLWNINHGSARTKPAFGNSLRRLELDWVDLYLIHWPASELWKESWTEMEKLYGEGLAKNIGVSNFTLQHLEQLEAFASVAPAVNQIELHPFNYRRQKPIVEYCQAAGITIEAYSPLAQMAWSENATLRKFADFYGKTVAQILLRWSVQHGAVPIPKATGYEHINGNLRVFDFQLSDAEMSALDKLSF